MEFYKIWMKITNLSINYHLCKYRLFEQIDFVIFDYYRKHVCAPSPIQHLVKIFLEQCYAAVKADPTKEILSSLTQIVYSKSVVF